jgi:hypothetical protein
VEWGLEHGVSPKKSLFSPRSISCDILKPAEQRSAARQCVGEEFLGLHHGDQVDFKTLGL